MFRTNGNPKARSLAVAGILALAALAAPSTGQAQSPERERALLNRTPPLAGAVAARALRLAAAHPAWAQPVDGERALTARIIYTPYEAVDLGPTAAGVIAQLEISGARALMGSVPAGPRR